MVQGNPIELPLQPRRSPQVAHAVQHVFPTYYFLGQARTRWEREYFTFPAELTCLLALDEPFSVIPASWPQRQWLVFEDEPRWTAALPTWRGISCRLGRVGMRSRISNTEEWRFRLLTLFPDVDPPDVQPFVYLGMQFLIESQATLVIDCAQPGSPPAAKLTIPAPPSAPP